MHATSTQVAQPCSVSGIQAPPVLQYYHFHTWLTGPKMSHLLQTTNEPSLCSEPIEQYEFHGLLLLSGLLESSCMLKNEETPDMESTRHLYHFH